MGRVEGTVALITGAARGMGRAHAIRLAEEGADIIAVDLCDGIASVEYGPATREDLAETVRLVAELGRRIVAVVADVRDQAAMDVAVRDGVAELGRLDIVSANAGITSTGLSWELPESTWQDVIDVNLTGVWHTVKAAAPPLIERSGGGSIILTSSIAGVRGVPNVSHYVAAKHGVIGLMKSLANELGPHRIRVNAVLPGNVKTDMLLNDVVFKLFRPDLQEPTAEDLVAPAAELTALPEGMLDARDVSNAVLWLASDEARYVTGICVSVDAGWAVT